MLLPNRQALFTDTPHLIGQFFKSQGKKARRNGDFHPKKRKIEIAPRQSFLEKRPS
jgi:hypothetical protein